MNKLRIKYLVTSLSGNTPRYRLVLMQWASIGGQYYCCMVGGRPQQHAASKAAYMPVSGLQSHAERL
jgi:hypothetical protein